MKGKYLITTNEWFAAPDGNEYRAIWGNVEILEDNILGVKTNRNSTNWYAKIGDEKRHAIISGCQINYAVKCDEKPYVGMVKAWTASAADGIKYYERPSFIYIAES